MNDNLRQFCKSPEKPITLSTDCQKLKSLKHMMTKKRLHFLNSTSLTELNLNLPESVPKFNVNNFLKISGSKLVWLNIKYSMLDNKIRYNTISNSEERI